MEDVHTSQDELTMTEHDQSVASPSESVSDNANLAPGENHLLPLPTHLSVRQLLAHQTQESICCSKAT